MKLTYKILFIMVTIICVGTVSYGEASVNQCSGLEFDGTDDFVGIDTEGDNPFSITNKLSFTAWVLAYSCKSVDCFIFNAESSASGAAKNARQVKPARYCASCLAQEVNTMLTS